jgi:hypothetical protein
MKDTRVFTEERRSSGKAKDELVGTWRLVSWESRRSDGEIVYPYGRDVIGILNYDAAGNMSVQFMRPDRPVFSISDPQKGTPTETKAAFDGFIAYFGTYEVNEKEGTVTHRLRGCSFPNWVGSDQTRSFEFSGNRLTVRAPSIQFGGITVSSLLIWERMA